MIEPYKPLIETHRSQNSNDASSSVQLDCFSANWGFFSTRRTLKSGVQHNRNLVSFRSQAAIFIEYDGCVLIERMQLPGSEALAYALPTCSARAREPLADAVVHSCRELKIVLTKKPKQIGQYLLSAAWSDTPVTVFYGTARATNKEQPADRTLLWRPIDDLFGSCSDALVCAGLYAAYAHVQAHTSQ